jgi:hypothetical protein
MGLSELSLRPPPACYLHGLLFDPEDGSSIFLRNVSELLRDCASLQFSNYCEIPVMDLEGRFNILWRAAMAYELQRTARHFQPLPMHTQVRLRSQMLLSPISVPSGSCRPQLPLGWMTNDGQPSYRAMHFNSYSWLSGWEQGTPNMKLNDWFIEFCVLKYEIGGSSKLTAV